MSKIIFWLLNVKKKINKCISMKILNEWIKKFSDVLDKPGIIQAHEFLYLVANCKNRTELV